MSRREYGAADQRFARVQEAEPESPRLSQFRALVSCLAGDRGMAERHLRSVKDGKDDTLEERAFWLRLAKECGRKRSGL